MSVLNQCFKIWVFNMKLIFLIFFEIDISTVKMTNKRIATVNQETDKMVYNNFGNFLK